MAGSVESLDLGFNFLSMDPLQKAQVGALQAGEVVAHWRSIGAAQGLMSDVDIAIFLIKYYENTWSSHHSTARCSQCHTPLTLCCLKCSLLRSKFITHSPTSPTSLASELSATLSSRIVQQKCPAVNSDENVLNGQLMMELDSGKISVEGRITQLESASSDVRPSGLSVDKDIRKNSKETSADKCENDDGLGSSLTVIDEVKNYETDSHLGLMKAKSEGLKCLMCSELFTKVNQLVFHMQAHCTDLAHRCDICKSAFLLPEMLALHRQTCTLELQKSDVRYIRHKTQKQCKQASSCALSEIQVQCTEEQCNRKSGKASSLEEISGKNLTSLNIAETFDHDASMYEGDTDVESDSGVQSSIPQMNQEDENIIQQSSEFLSSPFQRVNKEESVQNSSTADTFNLSECTGQIVTGSDVDGENGKEFNWCGCQYCGRRLSTCSRSFSSVLMHKAHMCQAGKHKTINMNLCQQCNVEFSADSELARHMNTRTENPRCSSTSQSGEKPVDKILPGNANSKRANVCDICLTSCTTAGKLWQHKKREHKERRKFQCGHCGKELCNMQTLTAHERTHTGAKPFQCPQCPSAFRSSSNLRAHLRTHTGHTPYLCPQCGRGFKEITHLKRHLVSHSGEKPHQCQLCGKAYVHATSLKEHMQLHSPSPKSWVCHQCGKAFANSKKLKVHLKTHRDKGQGKMQTVSGRRFTCLVCGAIYQQASSLSRHKKLHEMGVSPHSCSDCGKTFRDKYELRKHCRTHSGVTPYQCRQCPKAFRDASGYKRHLLSHSGLKPHVCSHCHKSYADSKSLKHHLQAHTGIKPYSCSQCSKAFFTPWTLRLHLQRHAEGQKSASSPGEKSHVCHLCGAAYLRSSSLVRHQRLHVAASGQTARYQCPQCSRSFGDSSHLKRHLLSHSGEKPFVCASCGKAYADSHTLKDHMQVHTGVRSFICEVCGKAFFNSKTLKEHARSHSNQRPFQCSQCSAAYKHLSGLISHKRLHSGVRPFQCSECSKTFKDYTCYKRHLLTHTHHKPHVCQQCGKAYKDLKNLRHHQTQFHGSTLHS